MNNDATPTVRPTLGQRAMRATLQFIIALALFIILPGGYSYWQGWVLWANLSFWCGLLTWYCLEHDPALLERRLSGIGAETEATQKRAQLFASVFFIASFLVSASDHRFGWSLVPLWVVIAGNLLVVLGFIIVFFVFRENSFASATIEIAAGQRVISTGPYALVRHPMYTGATLFFIGIPLALGSWWGLLTAPPLVGSLIVRLLHEEGYLLGNLPGYNEYRRKVRYRLVPGLW